MQKIKEVDIEAVNMSHYRDQFVGCVIISKRQKILLQKRGDDWSSHPGKISTFGGRIESEETPEQALIRELNEELGAKVNNNDIVKLGVYTESITNHTELVYGYFWYDQNASITGCYEGSMVEFDNVEAVLQEEQLMDDVEWLLDQCQKRCLNQVL